MDTSDLSSYNLPAELADWDRYRIEDFLGAGGMGQVFQAWDPRLKRSVALKFLNAPSPDHVRRFAREAQAQAQVEHENVCRIYEVGEVAGRPFIAMQLIRGAPLSKAARGLNLEQKLSVMRQVMDGVHAAHRTGLIHRDLKPSNILIEEDEEGGLHPYVLDFGLALVHDVEGATVTEAVVGTPAYMAPEQVHGDPRLLDRRTDVYALGSTLYELIGGERPFAGATTLALMLNVVEQEAKPLRQLDPSIPRDAETIVLKCLEKEPQRRYESVRALAEDLRRFQDGEPILARRASLPYLVGKLILRHRALSIVVAVSLALVFALAGYGVRARIFAGKQAATAQRFGEEIKEVEAILRFARMAPAHDISTERLLVGERMRNIEAQIDDIGSAAEGPGRYALGRGALALGDLETAAAELRRAWDAGYQPPEAAAALGLVHAELYRKAWEEAQRLTDDEAREGRVLEIQSTWRDPAVQFLNLGKEARSDAPGLVQAKIAILEERWDDALSAAQSARQTLPWLYEALLLEGEVLKSQADGLAARGATEEARELYDVADSRFVEAINLARSAVETYSRRAGLWLSVFRLLNESGQDPEPAYRQTAQICRTALEVEPTSALARVDHASAAVLWGEHQHRRGEDPTAAITEALELVVAALEQEPGMAIAHHTAGTGHVVLAHAAMTTGHDPRAHLERAVAAFERAVELHPRRAHSWQNMGNAYVYTGQYLQWIGEDSTAAYEKALHCYRKSLEISPEVSAVHSNTGLVNAHIGTALQDRGDDPTEHYLEAVRHHELAIAINPSFANPQINLSDVAASLGDYRARTGSDPVPDLERAIAAADRAAEIKPDFHLPHVNRGKALLLLAEYRSVHGNDPTELIAEAEASYQRGIELNPNDPLLHIHLGLAGLYSARHAVRSGEDPRQAVEAAVRAFRASAALHDDWVYPFHYEGEAYGILASWALAGDQDPTQYVNRAVTSFGRARKVNPEFIECTWNLAAVHLAAAAWKLTGGRSPEAELQAASALVEEVLAGQPDHASALLVAAKLDELRGRWLSARGESPEASWRKGLALAEAVAEEDPTGYAAEARIVLARLLLRLADLEAEGGGQDLIERADAVLGEVLESNPHHAEARAERGNLKTRTNAGKMDGAGRGT